MEKKIKFETIYGALDYCTNTSLDDPIPGEIFYI